MIEAKSTRKQTIAPGEVMTILARPGVGKTAFALNLMERFANQLLIATENVARVHSNRTGHSIPPAPRRTPWNIGSYSGQDAASAHIRVIIQTRRPIP